VRVQAVRFLRLCPKCRGKVKPNDGSTIGAWYCPRCDWRYTDSEVRQFVGNRPDAKVIHIGDRRKGNA